jgi:hypothetical protein
MTAIFLILLSPFLRFSAFTTFVGQRKDVRFFPCNGHKVVVFAFVFKAESHSTVAEVVHRAFTVKMFDTLF